VTNDQRNAAEAVFMSFRKTDMPYSICRYILGKVVFILINDVAMSFAIDKLSRSLKYIIKINVFHINNVISTYLIISMIIYY